MMAPATRQSGQRLEITSLANPLVKSAFQLRDKRHRKASGHFLAEGLRIATEARDSGILPAQLFVDMADAHPLAQRLAAETLGHGGAVIETNAAVLAKLSGKDNPQTVIGIYAEPSTDLATIDRKAADIWIVAQSLRDPGNVGTILRTGDAVGAGGLILVDDSVDPFSVETVRASMGAIFTQRIARTGWAQFLPWLRSGPGLLVAASLRPDSVDYRKADYPPPTFLLVGNESRGLPAQYEAECDLCVTMPMRGRADSLNAAIATAVLAYRVLDRQSG